MPPGGLGPQRLRFEVRCAVGHLVIRRLRLLTFSYRFSALASLVCRKGSSVMTDLVYAGSETWRLLGTAILPLVGLTYG